MARLEVVDGQLHVRLNQWERIFGLHGEFEVEASAIDTVQHVENPWPHIHGVRWPGTGLPDIICLGTLRHQGHRTFTAVYGRGAATIVTLHSGEFRQLIISGTWL